MHYPSLKRVIIENSKDNLTQSDDKNFYVKDGLDKASFYKTKWKHCSKISTAFKYLVQEIQTLHYPSVFYPSLSSLQTELLTFYILNFWFILYTVHSPQNILIPHLPLKTSLMILQAHLKNHPLHKIFIEFPYLPMTFHGTILTSFMQHSLFCFIM